MRTLIKNGTVVTAVDQYRGDVLIEDEKIALVGTSLDMQADKTIDASGKYVLPGGIDVHTHLDMPFGGSTSADDFETGTKAAADYALTVPSQGTSVVRLRLSDRSPDRMPAGPFGADFDATFAARIAEADAFYDEIVPASLSRDERQVMRQALAGVLWSKQ